jgi:hypothetical protein
VRLGLGVLELALSILDEVVVIRGRRKGLNGAGPAS